MSEAMKGIFEHIGDANCAICGKLHPNGGIHCPALDYKLVCAEHCYESCQYKEKDTSLGKCLYHQRIIIFAKSSEVETYRILHEGEATEWLNRTYDILFEKYLKGELKNKSELAAIRKLLFFRQFEGIKKEPKAE